MGLGRHALCQGKFHRGENGLFIVVQHEGENIRHIKDNPTPVAKWVRKLMEKKPFRLVSVALANKLARIAWGVLTRKETYQPYTLPA